MSEFFILFSLITGVFYEEEKKKLLTIYESLNGSTWKQNKHWGSDLPLRDWHGIKTNWYGQVTEITLCENNLSGELPDSISMFPNLTKLALWGNEIKGTIPESIYNDLTVVETIDLSCNHLTGNISESVGNLRFLTHLNLSKNELSGKIPRELGTSSYLQACYLHSNKLSGKIPRSIRGLKNLVFLTLDKLRFTGGTEHIFHLESLSKVPFEGFWDAYIVPAELEKADLQSKFAHFRNLKTV